MMHPDANPDDRQIPAEESPLEEDRQEEWAQDEPVELPIDGTLDLHTFRPAEIKTLIPDYLEQCLERKITQVRIIHGKGSGSLRRSVHAILQRQATVRSFRLADESAGSWGATLVTLQEVERP
ncbi:Smr/MutS family protein [Desulfogranum mediterraneum]|uniref:Smr/MutS family protein n=1 Tax=Desulfogranum mediterraneum TaxID=160661 RepID=UPI0004143E00|nr:Smr/MutS family protein [Desulfogranum mediterraneum]